MTGKGGRRNVTGRYSAKENLLILEDDIGDTGDAFFPMRCSIESFENGFNLTETEGSCSALNGVKFEHPE